MLKSAKNSGGAAAINPLKEAREKLEQAEASRRQGRFDQAEKICLKLLRQHPDYYGALHTLGMTYADKQEYRRALSPLFQAVTLNPNSWMTLTALSGICLNLSAVEMAADILERARKIKPNEPVVLATLGLVYTQKRDYELARDAFSGALKEAPDFLEASTGLARSHIFLGNDEEAAGIMRSLFSRGVRSLEMLSIVTQLPPGMVDVDLYSELDKLVASDNKLQKKEPEVLAFIRARADDWAGRYEDACKNLEIANNLFLEKLRKQLAAERDRQHYSLKWLEESGRSEPVTDPDFPISLFIFGPSRSGKTTLERLTSSLDGVKRGFENSGPERASKRTYQDAGLIVSWSLQHLPKQFYPQFLANYKEELRPRAGSAKVFTNTHPGYMDNIAHFAALVPNARFVFVKRNIEDLLLRIYMRSYQSGNAYAYSIPTIREHIDWYHKMMDTAAAKYPEIVRIISYEDMVEDPNAVLVEIAKLCGLKRPSRKIKPIADDRGCAEPYRDLLGL